MTRRLQLILHPLAVMFGGFTVGAVLNADSLAASAERIPFADGDELDWHSASVAVTSVLQGVQSIAHVGWLHRGLASLVDERTPGRLVDIDAEDAPTPARAAAEPAATTGGRGLLKPISPANPLRVLMIGDSLSEHMQPALGRLAQPSKALQVTRGWRYGSGLVRPDFYDWPGQISSVLAQHRPELVIVYMAGNDAQNMRAADGSVIELGTEPWKQEWVRRASVLADAFDKAGTHAWWLTVPAMENDKIDRTVKVINGLLPQVVGERPNQSVFDTIELLSPGFVYANAIPDPRSPGASISARAKDGVHLTRTSSELLAQSLLATIGWASMRSDLFVDAVGGASRLPEVTQHIEVPAPRAQAPATPSPAAAPAMPAAPAEPAPVAAPMPAVASSRPMPTCTEVAGSGAKRLECNHHSDLRTVDVKFRVWIPRTEGPNSLMVLLHGAWDSYVAWGDHADATLRSYAEKHHMVIVTPDGEQFGWWTDAELEANHKIESYLLKELIPDLGQLASLDRVAPSIAGLSMGGHGAVTIATRNLGQFTSASSMSGVLDLLWLADDPEDKGLPILDLDKLLGPRKEAEAVWKLHSARHIVERLSPEQLPPLLLGSGDQDKFSTSMNRTISKEWKDRGIRVIYEESPGDGHTWSYWTRVLPRHLDFHVEHLQAAGGAAR
jgi:S-formylglutathione hydrolase FrmB